MSSKAPLLFDPDFPGQGIVVNNSREELEYEEKRNSDFHIDDAFIAMSPYLMEIIGTFYLTLIIGLVVNNAEEVGALAPLGIGSGLMVLVFFGGHLSGAHYNPCVTIACKLTFRDHIGWFQSILYIIAQIFGSILASLVVWAIEEETFQFGPVRDYTKPKALIVEFIFSFLLASVMINTATTQSQTGNSFFGLAIGFTVLTAGYAIGPISGGVLNPAVASGAALTNFIHHGTVSSFNNVWIYWVKFLYVFQVILFFTLFLCCLTLCLFFLNQTSFLYQ
eukprot:TRINITY_DN533_c0_g1_i2.p1 TRINITY_DN533_c0_g1~~TRINITY_DN533_c0_g1_i2.p1  ORF type:complete len:278 (-),score=47.93 TRINITY_DN533_c0_g1_i2:155-988(-)